VFNTTAQAGDDGDSKETPVIKANKGMILRKSVDYIRYLQQLVTAQASRNRDLEAQIHRLTVQQQQQQVGSVDSSSSALTPEGPTMDLNQQNFHVFSEDLLNGVNAMGMVDILHTLTPEDSEEYLAIINAEVQSKKAAENGHAMAEEEEGGGTRSTEMELDDNSSGSGTSAYSPLAQAEEEERGRSREWSRLSAPLENGKAAPILGEKIAVKEEESPMIVV